MLLIRCEQQWFYCICDMYCIVTTRLNYLPKKKKKKNHFSLYSLLCVSRRVGIRHSPQMSGGAQQLSSSLLPWWCVFAAARQWCQWSEGRGLTRWCSRGRQGTGRTSGSTGGHTQPITTRKHQQNISVKMKRAAQFYFIVILNAQLRYWMSWTRKVHEIRAASDFKN